MEQIFASRAGPRFARKESVRCLVVLASVALGCGGGPPAAPPGASAADPLGGVEELLDVQTLPGDAPAEWPIAVAVAGGRYALPFHNGADLGVRIVQAGAAPVDVALGGSSLVGLTARGDAFAVATALGPTVTVWFEDATAVAVDITGTAAAPGLVSDGERVLFATSVHIDAAAFAWDVSAVVVAPDGAFGAYLGPLAATPSVFGDAGGFVVGSRWLLDGGFAMTYAPAAQIDGARLFLRDAPSGDAVTADGARWLDLTGALRWAQSPSSADDAIRIGLADAPGSERVLTAGADLTVRDVRAVPASARTRTPGWLRGFAGGRALYETVIDENDRAFAILDADTLAPRGVWARVRAPSSRTVVTALGATDVLLAWTDRDGCHYAIWPR
jgi:hypothetical protein